MNLLPYMRLAAPLGHLPRQGGGSMFRHQMETLGILLEYGHDDDPALLGAALVHDLLEDIEGADPAAIEALEHGAAALGYVREVTRRADESKAQFLTRVRERGSRGARLLKAADRLSNLVSLALSGDPEFIGRYCDESEVEVLPLAAAVDPAMAAEMEALIQSRRALLPKAEGGA